VHADLVELARVVDVVLEVVHAVALLWVRVRVRVRVGVGFRVRVKG